MYESGPQKESPGKAFLKELAKGESIEKSEQVAIVVAHQDDESIMVGGQLPRVPQALMIHITNGAPKNPRYWHKAGFETEEAYAAERAKELNAALDIAGHTGSRISLANSDQEAVLACAENARTLAELFKKNGTRVVVTHAYEGGHPDHDATAFAVHAAKELLQKEGIPLAVIEASVYRVDNAESVKQNFVPIPGRETVALTLTPEQQELKKKLFAAHATQQEAFPDISLTTEWLREAPEYDFTALPNNGHLSRLFTEAGVRESWTTVTRAALTELGLES